MKNERKKEGRRGISPSFCVRKVKRRKRERPYQNRERGGKRKRIHSLKTPLWNSWKEKKNLKGDQ